MTASPYGLNISRDLAIASGSRSTPTSLPPGPMRSRIARAWPARPSVASTIVSPGRGARNSSVSRIRTLACPSAAPGPCTRDENQLLHLPHRQHAVKKPRTDVKRAERHQRTPPLETFHIRIKALDLFFHGRPFLFIRHLPAVFRCRTCFQRSFRTNLSYFRKTPATTPCSRSPCASRRPR